MIHGKLRTVTDPVDRVWTLLYQDESDPRGFSENGPGFFAALQDPNSAYAPTPSSPPPS